MISFYFLMNPTINSNLNVMKNLIDKRATFLRALVQLVAQ